MKVKIDADLCTACGLCVDSAPEVFRMGNDVAEPISPQVPKGQEAAAREAAKDCPTEAIQIEE